MGQKGWARGTVLSPPAAQAPGISQPVFYSFLLHLSAFVNSLIITLLSVIHLTETY